MIKSQYLGKRVNRKKLASSFVADPHSKTEGYEKFLRDYVYLEADRKTGQNYFSLYRPFCTSPFRRRAEPFQVSCHRVRNLDTYRAVTPYGTSWSCTRQS